MKEIIDDAFLYTYIPESEKPIIDAIPDESQLDYVLSDRFERKMKKLIKYERRSKFSRVMLQMGKVAAIVLLIAALLNTVLVCSVQAYREQFFKIIKTVTEECTSFFIKTDSETITELIPIDPQYIPEGFEIVEEFCDSMRHTILYSNSDGQDIYYSQTVITNSDFYFDTENAQVETLHIAGKDVYSVIKGNTTQLYWQNQGYTFLVVGSADYQELILVAESLF